jgi:integrase
MAKQRNPKGMGHYYTNPDGKRYWRRRIDGQEQYLSADTPKELQEKVNEIIDLKITKSKLKVDEWFTKWLNYVNALRKKATYNQYNDIYKKHIKPEIGNRKLNGIKSYDIQAIILSMNKKGLSTWTMKHAKKVMNGAFSKAVKDKIISSNPVPKGDSEQKIDIPNRQAKPRKTLNHEELVKLFRQLESSRWIWSAKFMLVTGIRRGELLALRWSDIDYINNRITVDKSDSSTGLGDTKTKIHYIPLSPLMKIYLAGQRQMLEGEPNPILHNEDLKKANLVFPNKSGVMLKPGSYYTMMTRAAAKAGIKASPHCLRHTFVYMNRKKLSLKELQNILGHDESTTTLDIYGDMIDESTDETAKQMDETFKDLDADIKKSKMEQTAKIINLSDRRKAK